MKETKMHIIKYLLLSIIFLSFDGNCSSEVVEIEGVLDTNKKNLLKNNEHLSLYAVSPHEGVKDSKYFKNRRLIVSPETLNPDVITLRLQMCGLTDEHIIQIGKFTKIKKLELIANEISDQGMVYIKDLSQLEYLDLNNNQITDNGVQSITQLSNLKHLNLSLNREITDKGIDHLRNIPSLESLSINLTAVSYPKYKEISKDSKFTIEYFPLIKESKTNF